MGKLACIVIAMIVVTVLAVSVWALMESDSIIEPTNFNQVFHNNGGAISSVLTGDPEKLETIRLRDGRTEHEITAPGNNPEELDHRLASDLQDLEDSGAPLIAVTVGYSEGCMVSLVYVTDESPTYEYRGYPWNFSTCGSEDAIRITL